MRVGQRNVNLFGRNAGGGANAVADRIGLRAFKQAVIDAEHEQPARAVEGFDEHRGGGKRAVDAGRPFVKGRAHMR